MNCEHGCGLVMHPNGFEYCPECVEEKLPKTEKEAIALLRQVYGPFGGPVDFTNAFLLRKAGREMTKFRQDDIEAMYVIRYVIAKSLSMNTTIQALIEKMKAAHTAKGILL